MKCRTETGVGVKNSVVLHAVKMAFWQVYSVTLFKPCNYQNCGVLGFWLSQQLSVPTKITQVGVVMLFRQTNGFFRAQSSEKSLRYFTQSF